MKKEKTILTTIGMCVGVLALLSTSIEARTYTRGCNAHYFAEPTSIDGRTVRLPANSDFTGKGTVRIYAPTTARKKARANILECIRAHWRTRTSSEIPRECTEGNQIYNYNLRNIQASLANRICTVNPGHRYITARVGVIIRGDRGCKRRTRGEIHTEPVAEMLTESTSFTCTGSGDEGLH